MTCRLPFLHKLGHAWMGLLLGCLILAPSARAATTVNLDIRYTVESTDPLSLRIIANPFLYSDVPVTSFHRVESPNGGHSGQIGTNVIASSSLHPDLDSLFDALTNGVWKLWFNRNHPSEELHQFTLAIDGLTDASFPPVTISFPTNGTSNLPTTPVYQWTGPTNWLTLRATVRTPTFTGFQSASLPVTATSWMANQPLTEGSNIVEVAYTTNNWPGIVASAPTNGTGMVLSGFSLTNRIQSGSASLFRVGLPGTSTGNILVGHYAFDNSGNLGLDTSGKNNHITIIRSTGGSGPPAADGDAAAGSGAVAFDGGNWYVLPDAVRNAVRGNFSASLWLKTTQVFGMDTDSGFSGAGILAGDVTGERSFSLIPMALTGNKVSFFTGIADHTLRSGLDVNTGAYRHIVVTRSRIDGEKQIFIDGALHVSTTGLPNDTLNGISELALGINPSTLDGIDGLVDDVQIYAGLLSPEQIDFLNANPGDVIPDSNLPSLANAVDAPELLWFTEGDLPWEYQDYDTFDGEDAAASGDFGDEYGGFEYGGYSLLETTVTGPGTLTFYWKIESESGFSELAFFNRDTWFSIGGYGGYGGGGPYYGDWVQEMVEIGPGEDTLSWEMNYSPDEYYYYYYGQEQGFLDQVVFKPRVAESVELMDTQLNDEEFSFTFRSQDGFFHRVQSKTNLNQPSWQDYSTIPGNGNLFRIRFSTTNGPMRFFRVITE